MYRPLHHFHDEGRSPLILPLTHLCDNFKSHVTNNPTRWHGVIKHLKCHRSDDTIIGGIREFINIGPTQQLSIQFKIANKTSKDTSINTSFLFGEKSVLYERRIVCGGDGISCAQLTKSQVSLNTSRFWLYRLKDTLYLRYMNLTEKISPSRKLRDILNVNSDYRSYIRISGSSLLKGPRHTKNSSSNSWLKVFPSASVFRSHFDHNKC